MATGTSSIGPGTGPTFTTGEATGGCQAWTALTGMPRRRASSSAQRSAAFEFSESSSLSTMPSTPETIDVLQGRPGVNQVPLRSVAMATTAPDPTRLLVAFAAGLDALQDR